MHDPTIPAFLLRQAPQPRYMVTDDLSLVIQQGEQQVTLLQQDLKRLRDFFNRFDTEAPHAS